MTVKEKLQAIREINASMIAHGQATDHGNLSTFKADTTEVTLPLMEYDRLIVAQDKLKDMVRGIADGNAKIESQKLKLFHVFVTFPQQMAVNAATINKVEMTILSTDKRTADIHVTRMLALEGYDDLSATLINIEEIEGPFESGFVISRYG